MKAIYRVAMIAFALGAAAAQAIAADEWLPVREISLEVQAGSPLDFSGILTNPAIDSGHRLIAGRGGRLVFADAPERPQRLLCASLAWSPASGGFPDHAEADRYAEQLARHGYNVARLHFVDANLMFGRKKDLDFDPEILDRFHYLLAALKRNGIHWIMDGLTSWRGAYGGYDDRWDPSGNLKTALYFDDKAFAHWKRLQEELLARINPYTGTATIHEDALALIILVNENAIEFESVVHDKPGKPPYDPMIGAPFNRWLKERYGSTAALAKVWPDLHRSERLEDGTVALPLDRYVDTARLRDLQAFFSDTEISTAERMSRVLRDLGYRGLISSYNNWPTIQTGLSRRGLDVVTMNTYHDWIGGYQAGGRIEQVSSLADDLNYLRMIAATRWLGKPFMVSEYDHLFWNRFRYEAGIAVPAFAALQGWDALCRHAHGPIVLAYGEPYSHKRAMLPYAIALDPVARAGETIAALLFRRGDVATSDVTVPFAVRGEEDLSEDMQAVEPPWLTELALIGKIGLQDQSVIEGISVKQPRGTNDLNVILETLRANRELPTSNVTDIDAGLIESETGQILLDRRNGQLRVSTLAMEALAHSSLRAPVDLGIMTVENADGPGAIALASIDAEPSLETGHRFLLVFATDARNTGMRFRDREEKVIADYGRLPVLIRRGAVDLSLDKSARRWTLSPVGLDGMVHPPVDQGSGQISFRLSNDTPSGPTTYFLLELTE